MFSTLPDEELEEERFSKMDFVFGDAWGVWKELVEPAMLTLMKRGNPTKMSYYRARIVEVSVLKTVTN